MKRYDVDALILEHRRVAEDHYWMRLDSDAIGQNARPGQFIHLQVSSGTVPLLRRPLTVYRRSSGSFEVLYQVLGQGTRLLSNTKPGETLRVLGPLGNHFRVLEHIRTALVVGGGAGIASLMLLVEELIRREIPVIVLLGAQRASRLVAIEDLETLGVDMRVATDDGSRGHQGFVTELAEEVLRDGLSNRVVYGCGPTPMMQALSDITQRYGVSTQLALESYMGCALGVCLGCMVRIRRNGIIQHMRVCTEGPIFDAEEIVW